MAIVPLTYSGIELSSEPSCYLTQVLISNVYAPINVHVICTSGSNLRFQPPLHLAQGAVNSCSRHSLAATKALDTIHYIACIDSK